jgi:hypothetical protein
MRFKLREREEENPDDRRGHRHIGSLEDKRSGISMGKVPENDLDHPFVETRGGDRVTHRYFGYRGFELTENFCHRGIENSEIVRLDQGRPSVGDTWWRSRLLGKVLIESQVGASGFGVSRILRVRLPEHQKL